MQDAQGLCVHSLSVGYDKTDIVQSVDLAIATGQLTALVGPNGCGKSTLLKAIARILNPTAGRVMLGSRAIHEMPTREVAKQMALLPQGPIAPEGLTVQELVAQGRFPHQSLFNRWSADDSRAVAQAMADTDVEQFAHRLVSSLSGGQRQRCWLAMVLAQETEIILLDEPTTFLDLKVQVDVMSLLSRISRTRGRTLLVVLHELNIAAAFADQMVMMREGQIICEGNPESVMTAENIQRVFDLKATVMQTPVSGVPICVPEIH